MIDQTYKDAIAERRMRQHFHKAIKVQTPEEAANSVVVEETTNTTKKTKKSAKKSAKKED